MKTRASLSKTPAVVVGRWRGRVAQRERVCRGERRTEVELIDRTTPYNSAPRRGLFYAAGGGVQNPRPRASPTATSEYCWFTASIHRNLPLDRRHARVKA